MANKNIIITEIDILGRFTEMCAESLNPDLYSMLVDEIVPSLIKTRSRLQVQRTQTNQT